MIGRILILWLCAAGFTRAQDLAQDLTGQARTAVSEKRFGDAIALYRTVLAASPANLDAILWIARLSAWTRNYAVAEDFYNQALALDPKNVDAMLGKATLLLWKHSYIEALALLTEAHGLQPSNAEVELLWSRYYHWQGDDKDAKLHVEKSLSLDGGNQEAIDLRESLIPDHFIEILLGYEMDTLPGTGPGSIEQLSATYFNRQGDIGLDFFQMNRFGEGGNRGGLHFSRNLGARTTVRGEAEIGEGGDIVPKQDFSAGISRRLPRGLVMGFDYRYLAFRTIKVDSAIADMEYYFEKPMWIQASFAGNRVEGATTPSLLVRFNARVRKNLTLNAGYGHGTEVFQLSVPTDFASFRRDSYIGGAVLALSKKNRVQATYSLARRSTGAFENMFLLALVHTL